MNIDPEEYISVENYTEDMDAIRLSHETERANKEMQIAEMDKVIKDISADLYAFCNFAIESNGYFLTPEMGPNDGYIPEQIEGASNVNACVCKLSNLRKLNDGEDDIYVLAFMHGNDYMSTTDGKYVIASTIGKIPVNSLVINGFENLIDENLYDRYFAEETAEAKEEEKTEVEEQPELVEGEVIGDGDNAETDNTDSNRYH